MSNVLSKLTKTLRGDIEHNYNNCSYCAKCEEVCHHKAININTNETNFYWNTENCIRCGHCIRKCTKNALKFKKTRKE